MNMHTKCTLAVFKLACRSNWHIVDMPPEEDKIEVCAVAVCTQQLQKQGECGWVHMRKKNWQHLVFIISLC